MCAATAPVAASATETAHGRQLPANLRDRSAPHVLVGIIRVYRPENYAACRRRSTRRGCVCGGRHCVLDLVASTPIRATICDGMSFDTLAPHYRWMELVLAGEKLQRCRTAFLRQIAPPKNILIWGEGNGRFLLECHRAWRRARIVCADASGRMLELAKRRVERNGLGSDGIEFLRADVLDWSAPKDEFDLIVTHFFLDCFQPEQLQRIVTRLAAAARSKAAWLMADFQAPEFGLQRFRAKMILKTMYLFFRIATGLPARRLTRPDPFLASNEFVLKDRRVSEWGLLHSDLWQRG